jgi:hypothetical protein
VPASYRATAAGTRALRLSFNSPAGLDLDPIPALDGAAGGVRGDGGDPPRSGPREGRTPQVAGPVAAATG